MAATNAQAQDKQKNEHLNKVMLAAGAFQANLAVSLKNLTKPEFSTVQPGRENLSKGTPALDLSKPENWARMQDVIATAIPMNALQGGTHMYLLHYNPVYDIAFMTRWVTDPPIYKMNNLVVALGEQVRGEPIALLPAWVATNNVGVLQATYDKTKTAKYSIKQVQDDSTTKKIQLEGADVPLREAVDRRIVAMQKMFPHLKISGSATPREKWDQKIIGCQKGAAQLDAVLACWRDLGFKASADGVARTSEADRMTLQNWLITPHIAASLGDMGKDETIYVASMNPLANKYLVVAKVTDGKPDTLQIVPFDRTPAPAK